MVLSHRSWQQDNSVSAGKNTNECEQSCERPVSRDDSESVDAGQLSADVTGHVKRPGPVSAMRCRHDAVVIPVYLHVRPTVAGQDRWL